jgi:hypothetical protein
MHLEVIVRRLVEHLALNAETGNAEQADREVGP